MKFSGSYAPGQVDFLLKLLPSADFHSVAEKELLIQSGEKHYSEMLSFECLPSAEYMAIFDSAVLMNGKKMAQDCLRLAAKINSDRPSGLVALVSLMRAGTPVGVILKEILEKIFKRDVVHYSVSIIRDVGVDSNALRFILGHGVPSESIVFVDGWTGKGVITHVLRNSISLFNRQQKTNIDPGLYVLVDIAGQAKFASCYDDYLIPSCVLNATVSGLVSRSVFNAEIGEGDFHGCIYYQEYLAQDQSRRFVETIMRSAIECSVNSGIPAIRDADVSVVSAISDEFIATAMKTYSIADRNLIKPGIGEATRVLLRRVPRLLILREIDTVDVAHLVNLAKQKAVLIEVDKSMPYQAVSLIGSSLDG